MSNQKSLKAAYKELKPQMGVFQIRNKVNHKIMIDGSTDLRSIWNRHRTQLNFGSHPNVALQLDWNSFGEENFVFEVLGEIKTNDAETRDYKKDIEEFKQMFMEELQPFEPLGYHVKKSI